MMNRIDFNIESYLLILFITNALVARVCDGHFAVCLVYINFIDVLLWINYTHQMNDDVKFIIIAHDNNCDVIA